jgi:hypothetical protein
MTDAATAIIRSLGRYFDALYFGDADLFAELFHERARLFCVDGDQLVEMDLPQYLRLVAGRESPAFRKQRREEQVLSISVPTPTTAHARVRELFIPKLFTDELTFVLIGGEWKIISKVWHFDPSAAS